jgi:hypothetical protein
MFPTATSLVWCSVAAVLAAPQTPGKDDAKTKIRAAGSDVTKLLQLAADWQAQQRPDAAQKAWQRVLELDAQNATARAGLHHTLYDGRWFDSQTALLDYKRAEDARMQKQGLARAGDRFVPIADAPFVRLGWQKGADGRWQHPLVARRLQRDTEPLARGCQQQDLVWIEPADFDRWRQGQWRCGEQWLDTAAADAWHADPERPWQVPSEHFVISTTVDRARVEWCKWYADRTWPDLVRLFGVAPGQVPSAVELFGPQLDRPEVVVWNSLAQYNKFAGNAETQGVSSLHYACFADALFDDDVKPAAFAGLGCGFWDRSTPALDGFGQHSIRHAAAQSFVEAIDPSWQALGEMALENRTPASRDQSAARSQVQSQAFWAEKRIPRWLRYGACNYVERWFVEPETTDGQDREWARKWARLALQKGGGLRSLDALFEFKLTPGDAASSTQRIHEAGCVVAFVLDGGDARVQAAHRAFQEALRGPGSTAAAVAELQAALRAAQPRLLAFAAQ